MPFELTYTVSDDDGDRATTSVNVPITFSLTDYASFAVQMATLVDALLHGKVESAELAIGVSMAGLINNIIGSTSDVEEVGAFVFDTVLNTRVNINVPGLDEGMVGAGSDELNQGVGAVATFISAIEGGVPVTGGTISPCDVGEAGISQVLSARERFRASGSRS